MKPLIPILTAVLLLGAAPALAGERGHGGCGGGCGGYPGGNHNANINVNVNAGARASAYAAAGSYINARAYDVRSIHPRGPVYGGLISTGGGGYGGVADFGAVSGPAYGPVAISGPGYGPSRPLGYAVYGFGRRYGYSSGASDQCSGGCGHTPPPPPVCHDPCRGSGYSGQGYGHPGHGGQGHGGYSHGHPAGISRSSYSVHESYSETAAYAGGYPTGYSGPHRNHGGGPAYGPPPEALQPLRYTPIPYHAAPLEPVTHAPGYAPQPSHPAPAPHYAAPPGHDSAGVHAPEPYRPPAREPLPHYAPPADDYYGDLPPGDAGEGMPYRQEPGERG